MLRAKEYGSHSSGVQLQHLLQGGILNGKAYRAAAVREALASAAPSSHDPAAMGTRAAIRGSNGSSARRFPPLRSRSSPSKLPSSSCEKASKNFAADPPAGHPLHSLAGKRNRRKEA